MAAAAAETAAAAVAAAAAATAAAAEPSPKPATAANGPITPADPSADVTEPGHGGAAAPTSDAQPSVGGGSGNYRSRASK